MTERIIAKLTLHGKSQGLWLSDAKDLWTKAQRGRQLQVEYLKCVLTSQELSDSDAIYRRKFVFFRGEM